MGLELIAIAGLLLLGAGVAILVVNLSKERGAAATIDQIQTYGYVAETTGGADDAAARRPLDSIAGRVGDWAARRSDRFSEQKIREKLVSAGMYGTSPRKILGYQIICAIAFSMLVSGSSPRWAVRSCSPSSSRLPQARRLVRADVLRRAQAPEAHGADRQADAGHDRPARRHDRGRSRNPRLDARRVGEHVRPARPGAAPHAPGAADGSLRRSGDRESRSSRGRPNMRIFVRAITQGERLGVSIGTTMRNLSVEMRKRRRAIAEERAQKMPVKMLFPLIFFIFPALFIVILTPMIISIMDALG